jgi:fatty acid desaturase
MVSPVMNLFLFNNGCHTAHHAKPEQHWSEFPLEHAKIQDKLKSLLIEKSRLWFVLRTYLIAPLGPTLHRSKLRAARLNRSRID